VLGLCTTLLWPARANPVTRADQAACSARKIALRLCAFAVLSLSATWGGAESEGYFTTMVAMSAVGFTPSGFAVVIASLQLNCRAHATRTL
jgi:hypothetical protein